MRDASEIKKGSRGGEMFRDMFRITSKYWGYDPINDGADDEIGHAIMLDVSQFIQDYQDDDSRIAKLAEGFGMAIMTVLLDEERDYRNAKKSV